MDTDDGLNAGLSSQFESNYTELTNDQPIHICIKIDKNIMIRDIARKIMQIKEVNVDLDRKMKKGYIDLVLYSKSLGTVRGIFDPLNKLT